MMDRNQTSATDDRSTENGTTWSRRRFVATGLATGLGVAAAGASSSAAAQPSGAVPSVDEAAEQLSHPDPSIEAVALYRYLHDEWGERILSGQQYEPWWGTDEMDHIESVTGHLPAVQGADFIHDDKSRPVEQAIDWWERGGITSIMWHWGVPGQETPEDEYEQSRDTGVEIDLQLILEEGTDPNEAFWAELAEVADELERLRDAGIPIIWRPFHEFEGGWFWWGVEGPDFFVELWETMHDYFAHERDLDNLIWLLPHSDYPDPAWVPDESTFDLWGADTYDEHDTYAWLYDDLAGTHGEDRPIVKHETGLPPHPEDAADAGAWWSHWITWHTDWLTGIDDAYLEEVYTHDLTVTLEDVPDIVDEYGEENGGIDPNFEYDPQDTTGDGLLNDFDGDGRTTHDDVEAFFESIDHDASQNNPDAFDFDGDGSLGFGDVVDLLRRV